MVLVLVGVLVGDGGGVDVGVLVGVLVGVGVLVEVGVDVGDEELEPQDTVKLTYWFCPLEATVVLAGVIVQPGTVVAVRVTLAPGQ